MLSRGLWVTSCILHVNFSGFATRSVDVPLKLFDGEREGSEGIWELGEGCVEFLVADKGTHSCRGLHLIRCTKNLKSVTKCPLKSKHLLCTVNNSTHLFYLGFRIQEASMRFHERKEGGGSVPWSRNACHTKEGDWGGRGGEKLKMKERFQFRKEEYTETNFVPCFNVGTGLYQIKWRRHNLFKVGRTLRVWWRELIRSCKHRIRIYYNCIPFLWSRMALLTNTTRQLSSVCLVC